MAQNKPDTAEPTGDERRLIEDYLPIQAISAEASREKSVRKGHIATLHLWWARRPLVAARAAVYGALVPSTTFPDRAAAGEFVAKLCKYPGDPATIAAAQQHILAAHAERLTKETGRTVTVQDIELGHAPRPKVLDMFAGGGSIPLEALRLGCTAYTVDLNPVAHIIELCTLVYPQKFGAPDPGARGSSKDGAWSGLAAEVEYWGGWVGECAKREIAHLYPSVPDPDAPGDLVDGEPQTTFSFAEPAQKRLKFGRSYLTPVAYLWSRTVRCKDPACGAVVPLVKQTWLCKKAGRFVAMKMIPIEGENTEQSKRVRFQVVEAATELGLGFDPTAFSKGGNATCPFCNTVADSGYVMRQGLEKKVDHQLMAVACTRPNSQGKVYLGADELSQMCPGPSEIRGLIERLGERIGWSTPKESISPSRPSPNSRGLSAVTRHGLDNFGDLFTARQTACLMGLSRPYEMPARRWSGRASPKSISSALWLILETWSINLRILIQLNVYGIIQEGEV